MVIMIEMDEMDLGLQLLVEDIFFLLYRQKSCDQFTALPLVTQYRLYGLYIIILSIISNKKYKIKIKKI